MFRLYRRAAAFCLGFLLAGPVLAAQIPSRSPDPAMPLFHGHWCGIGDVDRAAPIDAFDAACRAHDLCYEKRGRNACSCDRALLEATAALVNNPATEETVRSKAATANSLFSAAPCREREKSIRSTGKR